MNQHRRPWSKTELRLLGRKPDRVVAAMVRRTEKAVRERRKDLRIPQADSTLPRWTPAEEALLGTAPDEEIARKLGRTRIAVLFRRCALGIPSANAKGPRLSAKEKARLARPDPTVLRELGGKEISVPRSLSAEDQDRLRLLYGPYYPPRTRRGAHLFCELRGTIRVGGYSDAPIPWPYAWRTGYRSLLLCGDLVRAVRLESEQAVAHHWKVSRHTVGKWRQALDVEVFTPGTWRVVMRAVRLAGTPEAREKISAAMWGKPANWSPALRARILALAKRPKSEAFKRKMSRIMRRKHALGLPPKRWTPEEERLLGTLPDRVIARRLDRSLKAVQGRRFLLRSRASGPRVLPS
jgi:hypothetical protein